MSKPVDTYVIRTRKQMAALKAPTRQEIVDTLAPMGDVSVVELAAALGLPADALYYHLRILQKAGLVLDAGERDTGTRRESLFRTVAPDMRLAYKPGLKGNAQQVTPIVNSMLRLTTRNFAEALNDPDTVVDGEHRELWATRTTSWLTEEQLAEVNHFITQLVRRSVSSSPMQARLFGLTMVLTPLNRTTEAGHPQSQE